MEKIDFLTVRCRAAGITDKKYIEAARFGAKCLADRIIGDWPDVEDEYKLFEPHTYCSIWRDPCQPPKESSIIVLRNSTMIAYALYKSGMCYYEGYSARLEDFVGQWCYKEDMFGIRRTGTPAETVDSIKLREKATVPQFVGKGLARMASKEKKLVDYDKVLEWVVCKDSNGLSGEEKILSLKKHLGL